MLYDVVIVGGGPAGLSAALALGRARKRVLLCDAGPRRNAAAEHMHNFVTRDGTPPDEFRRIGRAQLGTYPSVDVRDACVERVAGEKGAFRVVVEGVEHPTRRVLLCTGVVDEMLEIDGFREAWGRSIVACPYCHGWEARDRPWGYLARANNTSHLLPFAVQLRGWTSDVVVFTNAEHALGEDVRRALSSSGIRLETQALTRLVVRDGQMEAVQLADGTHVPCALLFAHPPQQQTRLVQSLGLALDADGYVAVDPMRRESSVPGIFASGDLTTRMQGALPAAAAGLHAASVINLELTMELALAGGL